MIAQPKPVVTAPVKVAQPNVVQANVSWVGGQVNQNIVQPLTNTVKKIGNNITAKLVQPQSTMLKDAGIDTAKAEKLILKPNQKKLAPEQLQKVTGASATLKPQSKDVSLKKAEEIRKATAQKIASIEKVFNTNKIEPKKLPKGYKEPGIMGDMVDALKEGIVSTIGSIGAGVEMEGRKAKANPYDINGIAMKFLATNVGRKISAESDNILASNPEWQADPKAKLLMANNVPNPKTIARLGVGAAPSILINIAATIATVPVGGWGGLVTGYLMEGGSTYKEAKKAGVSEDKAQFYGTTVGVVNSIFEHLMPASSVYGKRLFKEGVKEVGKEAVEEVSKSFAKEAIKQAKKFGINILKNGAIEGSTEGIQEFWSNVIATNYDKNRKPWDNIIESMVGGFVGGGVAGGSTKTAIDNNIIVIPDGEHTPQAVIGQVIANKQENTVEGRELLKTAVEAQQKGQNVLIETTKQGEVNSEVQTINQEEIKVEKPKVEYTDGAIKKLQDQMDTILGIDPNIKVFSQRQKAWGTSYQATQEAADAGIPEAIADIDKLVELQGQIEDMRDARQTYLKSKKTKKSAKEYVESKVKERSVKFRQNVIAEQGSEVKALLEDEKIMAKITNEKTNPRFFMDDTVALEDIKKRIDTNKATQKDIDTALEILETAGYGPKFIKTYFHFADYQAKKASGELGAYVNKKGPKFREDPNQTQTLDELLAIKTPNLEQLKLINKMRAEQMAKSKEKSAEDIGEEKMGWKDGQKDAFDNAVSRKDTATVKEMLKDVPEYYKAEFKTQIDEALSPVRQYVADKNDNRVEKFREVNEYLREGQPEIGRYFGDGVVARERFNIPILEKLSSGGSDRDVYDLGNYVLKIAKTARGLAQNSMEGDIYAPVPKLVESGLNYVVVDKVGSPNANTKKLVAELKELNTWELNNERDPKHYDEINKAVEIMEKYGIENGDMISSYNVMWNDFVAIRNWGTDSDGSPIHVDAGTFNNSVIQDYRGKKNLDDADFRKAYYDSKAAKKKYLDRDDKTMYRVRDDVKKMTGRIITDAQEQELIDLNRKFMGDDKVSIVLQIMANEKALGKYQDGMIEILDGQMDPKATLMHEIGHKYLDVFSTTEEYVAVLEEGAKKYKTDDFVEVEEQIVERLNEVAKEWDTFNKSVEGLDPITKFLVTVIRRIKIYFANKSAINRLYNDILEGKAAKRATKMAQETTPAQKTDIPTNEIAQTPVGEGDKTKSKAYTRVYDRLAEEAQQDVSYNKLNLEKDTQNALDFITTDPKAAIRVGLGLEEAPTGQTETAISIALADKAGRDGDFALQSQLESSRSLRQTRRGQEIVSERGRFNEDSPHFFIRELMDMRLKNIGSNLKSSLEELQGKAKSVKKAAIEKIDKGVSKLKEKIKEDRKKITLAQDIIDSIIC